MPAIQIEALLGPDALAARVAGDWLDLLSAGERRRSFSVALSGGRIATRFFASFVELARRRNSRLEQMEFFWADERCVPPDDPESNFATAQQQLLRPLQIPAERIHRIRGELDKDSAAVQAEQEMRLILPSAQNAPPTLDLVFLGMGEDGHVASLFPGEPEAVISLKPVFRGVIGSKPPPNRVTMNFSTLAAAREVWVMVSGAGKEDALRRSLPPAASTPLGRLLALRTETKIFTDFPFAAPALPGK